METKYKFFIAGVVICVALIAIIESRSKRRIGQHFTTFYSTNINGQIDSVRIAYRGIGLQLTDKREFFFYANVAENDNRTFEYTAEKGDSIVKPAYGDTIYLKKTSGEVLKYTFMHF